ncbi:MAG TPA: hypothetical protein VGE67_14130, partial [Haloferula sp.]
EKVLKFTKDVLDKDLQGHIKQGAGDVIEQGREVLDDAKGAIKEVKGIFDILGGKEGEDE